MKVELKSNGNTFEIAKADFDKFSKDQKRSYRILDKNDSVETSGQTAKNKVADKDKKNEEVKP